MSASVSGNSDTMSLMAAWVVAELRRNQVSRALARLEGTMVSTPLLPAQLTPLFDLRPNRSVDPEPQVCTSGYIDTRPSLA